MRLTWRRIRVGASTEYRMDINGVTEAEVWRTDSRLATDRWRWLIRLGERGYSSTLAGAKAEG